VIIALGGFKSTTWGEMDPRGPEGEMRTPAGGIEGAGLSQENTTSAEGTTLDARGWHRPVDAAILAAVPFQMARKRSANSENSYFLAIWGATLAYATQTVSYRLQGVAKSVAGHDDGARAILGRSSDVSIGASGCAGRVHRARWPYVSPSSINTDPTGTI